MARTFRKFSYDKSKFDEYFIKKFERGLIKLSLFDKGIGKGYQYENITKPKTKAFIKKKITRKERHKLNA
jgi:hypothetical protein